MTLRRTFSERKLDSPKALGAVARQQVVLIQGLLNEVSRNYLARLQREITELLRVLDRAPSEKRPAERQMKDLRVMLEKISELHIDPERGRRKDLKKIDALIGELQSMAERWQ